MYVFNISNAEESMGRKISGIKNINKNGYSIFWIDSFTDDLKSVIRCRLSAICHGIDKASSNRKMYCYKKTLEAFVERYDSKTDDQKKGMIGELLLHILLAEVIDEFEVNSLFFNMEEKSVKKGFDVILTKLHSTELWIAEVKSGELHKDKDSSQTVVSLINTAQNDLNKRLNEDNVTLWLNAVHGAQIAISEERNEKDAIISILEDYGDNASDDQICSREMNVVLVGTLFNQLSDPIEEQSISKKHKKVVDSAIFKEAYIIAIQQETYQEIFDFIESESKE